MSQKEESRGRKDEQDEGTTTGAHRPEDESPADKCKTPFGLVGRTDLLLCLVIFLAAVGLRGAYLLDSRDNPAYGIPLVDAETYDIRARKLAEKGILDDMYFRQGPLYPTYLAGVYFFTGGSIVAARGAQALLAGITCALTYLLGLRLLGRACGLIAAVFTACYGPLIFFDLELLPVGLAALMSVLLIHLFLWAKEQPGALPCFLVGLVGALLILTRPNFLLFFAAAAGWLVVVYLRSRMPAREVAWLSLRGAVGFAVVALPAAYAMYRHTGLFSILPTSGGMNLYIGNNPDADETINIRPGWRWERLKSMPQWDEGVRDPGGKQRYFVRRAWRYATDDPAAFARGLLGKTTAYFCPREIPRNVDIYMFRRWSGVLRSLVWKVGWFGFPFGLLLPLMVLGMVMHWRDFPVVLWLYVLFVPAAVILVFVAGRYRAPSIPVFSVLAAAGCVGVVDAARRRAWISLAVGVGLAAVSILPWLHRSTFPAERPNYRAELYAAIGAHYRNRGKLEKAYGWFQRAQSENQRNADVTVELGTYWMRKAVQARTQGRLGDVRGRLTRAFDLYNQARALAPKNPDVYRDLGVAYEFAGEADKSIAYYEQSLELDPTSARTHYLLGRVLHRRAQGTPGVWAEDAQADRRRAIEHLRKAVELDDSLTKAQALLERLQCEGG